MRWSATLFGILLIVPFSSPADDRVLDWMKVTDRAGWQPRDSSGEVVYKDRLWLLGGWFDSFSAPPRDVWSSPNGATWTLATKNAPWKSSDLPMALSFDGRMWLMGGWFNGRLPGHSASREVWSLEIPKDWFDDRRQALIAAADPALRRLGGSVADPARPAPALEPIPDKLVVLTFDDASKSHATVAAPLLKKYGFCATFFVTEGFDFPTNKRDYMTWDEIARLHRDGFEIGNHTRDHKSASAKDPKGMIEQIESINAQCLAHSIPRTVSFAYPGNVLDRDVLPILRGLGIKFARRGGSPEHTYDKGRGFAYEPGLDHPLLIPSAGDARPAWTLDDFKRAVAQARGGRIAVIQFHGVPDTAHSWVNTPATLFESYLKYLADNGYRTVALRDLARYVDAAIVPSNPWGVIDDRKAVLSSGRDGGSNARPARSDAELRGWLSSMLIHHRYNSSEAGAALGFTADEVHAAAKRLGVLSTRPDGPLPLVLPYPGGRHPRTGFLDGAIRPQRETKVSLFAPWADGGYAVADVPEAVWHDTSSGRRKLLYLAHTHVPTVWDEQGVTLPPLEWTTNPDGSLEVSRLLPNKVTLTSRVTPGRDGTRMEFRVTNGSSKTLTGLDIQMCVMLKGLSGFGLQSNDNKVFQSPFAAARDASGLRWVITAWDGCKRAWGNPPCPCIHSDPRLPDCPPGESKRVTGWVSFYEGPDIEAELKRLAGVAFGKS
jgi:peptidoglycan/xylan/chitin deacetylase (PgdA/CDA1 family)